MVSEDLEISYETRNSRLSTRLHLDHRRLILLVSVRSYLSSATSISTFEAFSYLIYFKLMFARFEQHWTWHRRDRHWTRARWCSWTQSERTSKGHQYVTRFFSSLSSFANLGSYCDSQQMRSPRLPRSIECLVSYPSHEATRRMNTDRFVLFVQLRTSTLWMSTTRCRSSTPHPRICFQDAHFVPADRFDEGQVSLLS